MRFDARTPELFLGKGSKGARASSSAGGERQVPATTTSAVVTSAASLSLAGTIVGREGGLVREAARSPSLADSILVRMDAHGLFVLTEVSLEMLDEPKVLGEHLRDLYLCTIGQSRFLPAPPSLADSRSR